MSFTPDQTSTPLKNYDTNQFSHHTRQLKTYSRAKFGWQPAQYIPPFVKKPEGYHTTGELMTMERQRAERAPREDVNDDVVLIDPFVAGRKSDSKAQRVSDQWKDNLEPLRRNLISKNKANKAEGRSRRSNDSPYKVGSSSSGSKTAAGAAISSSRMSIPPPRPKQLDAHSTTGSYQYLSSNAESGPSRPIPRAVVDGSRQALRGDPRTSSDITYRRQGTLHIDPKNMSSDSSDIEHIDKPNPSIQYEDRRSPANPYHPAEGQHPDLGQRHRQSKSHSRSSSPTKSNVLPNPHNTRARQRQFVGPQPVVHNTETIIAGGRNFDSRHSNGSANPISLEGDDEEDDPRVISAQTVNIIRPKGRQPFPARKPDSPQHTLPSKPKIGFGGHARTLSNVQPGQGRQTRNSLAASLSPEKADRKSPTRNDTVGRGMNKGKGKGRAVDMTEDSESEEEEKIEIKVQDEDEGVDPPDGPFRSDLKAEGIELIENRHGDEDRKNTLKSVSDAWAIKNGPASRDLAPAKTKVVPLKGKNHFGRLFGTALSDANASISTTLKTSGKASPQLTAEVDVAWFLNIRLNVGYVQYNEREIVLFSRSDSTRKCHLKLNQHVTQVWACASTEHSFLNMNLQLGSGTAAQAAFSDLILAEEDDKAQFQDLQLNLVFHVNSGDGEKLVSATMDRLLKLGIKVLPLPSTRAATWKNGYPPAAKPTSTPLSSKQRTRMQAAAAAEKRADEQGPTRPKRSSNVEKVDPVKPANPKAKASKGKADEDSEYNQTKLTLYVKTGWIKAIGQGLKQIFGSSKVDAKSTVEASRRSTRHSVSKTYNEPDASDDGPSEPRVVLTESERREKLFSWPPNGRADLNIDRGDRERITSNEFLNDTLLEFGLRYVLDQLEKSPPESGLAALASDVHLFNSFFFVKLVDPKHGKQPPDADALAEWPAYEAVKRWTRNAHIFDKKYVIVPINEMYHWYFAIIYNPAGILKAPVDSADEDRGLVTPGNGHAKLEEDVYQALLPSGSTTQPRDGDYNERDLDEILENNGDAQPNNGNNVDDPMTGNLTSTSIDELALQDGHDWEGKYIKETTADLKNMNISSMGPPARVDPPAQGIPISSFAYEIYKNQHQELDTTGPEVPTTPGPTSPPPKKKVLEDHRILDSDDCWIITVDSLGGAHTAVKAALERWLHYEARDKKNVNHRLSPAQYCEAKVPQQSDFHNCGLFLIHYAEQFLQSPDEMLRFIQRRQPTLATRDAWSKEKDRLWKSAETGDLRVRWKSIIDYLAAEQGVDPEKPGGDLKKGLKGDGRLEGGGEQAGDNGGDEDSFMEMSQMPAGDVGEGIPAERGDEGAGAMLGHATGIGDGVRDSEDGRRREKTIDSLNSRTRGSRQGTSFSRMEEQVEVRGEDESTDTDERDVAVDPNLGAVGEMYPGGVHLGEEADHARSTTHDPEQEADWVFDQEAGDDGGNGLTGTGDSTGAWGHKDVAGIIYDELEVEQDRPLDQPRIPSPNIQDEPLPFPDAPDPRVVPRQATPNSDQSDADNTSTTNSGYRRVSGADQGPPPKKTRLDTDGESPLITLGLEGPGMGISRGVVPDRSGAKPRDGARFLDDEYEETGRNKVEEEVGMSNDRSEMVQEGTRGKMAGRDGSDDKDFAGSAPTHHVLNTYLSRRSKAAGNKRALSGVSPVEEVEPNENKVKRHRGEKDIGKDEKAGKGGHSNSHDGKARKSVGGKDGGSLQSPITIESDNEK